MPRSRPCPIACRLFFAVASVFFAVSIVACSTAAAPGSGGDPPASGNATREADTCAALKQVASECYNQFCRGDAGTDPFCTCWLAGQDISTQTCQCIAQDLDAICRVVNLDSFDPSHFDCAKAASNVATVCVH